MMLDLRDAWDKEASCIDVLMNFAKGSINGRAEYYGLRSRV